MGDLKKKQRQQENSLADTSLESASTADNMFNKRTGTTDVGHDYENAVMANIVLQHIFHDSCKDFLVWSNDENFGAFDDVILQSDIKCAMQLKHASQKTLTVDALKSSNNFGIKKYFDSFVKNKAVLSNYDLVLFTPLKFSPGNNQKLSLFDEEEFLVQIIEVDVHTMINTRQENRKCFQFKIVQENPSNKVREYEKFFDKFFIYANQVNVFTLEKNISKQIEKRFSCKDEVSKKYLDFFTKWNLVQGYKRKLDKSMIKRLLALYLVSANLRPISFGKISDNRKRLQAAMFKFHVTIFSQECSQNIWVYCKSNLNEKEVKVTNGHYQITKFGLQDINNLTDEDCMKILWVMDKCPLIVEESPAVYQAMSLCSDRRFIVLTTNRITDLEENSVFSKLSNLKCYPENLNEILSNFKFIIAKKEFSLEQIQNEELQDDITTNDLLLAVDKPYTIKQEIEELPETYIQRKLTRNIINSKFLSNIDEDTIVFISNVKKQEDLKKYDAVDVKQYLSDKANKQIVFMTDDQNSECWFRQICDNKSGQSYHHLKMMDGKLEWIKSVGGFTSLKQHCKQISSIKEDELSETNGKNNIHVVVGDPGLGKTCFLKSLKNRFISESVVTLFTPQDMKKICDFIKKSKGKLENFLIDLKYSNCTKFDRCVVQRLADQNKVIYLWDGLDELNSDKDRSTILEVVRTFSEKGIVQWMTSRTHLKDALETKFGVLSRTLVEFDKNQQIEYIQKRLEPVCPNEVEREELTDKILSNVSILKHRDILSIPLQIYMFTEICREDKDKISDLKRGAFSLANLYEYFVEQKFNFCYKKYKIGDDFLENFKLEINTLIKVFEKTALMTRFEEDILNKLNVDDIDEILEESRGFGDKFGFVTEVVEYNSKVSFKFSHISYAEYFAGSYLARQKKIREASSKVSSFKKNTQTFDFF